MAEYNGGMTDYPARVTKPFWARACGRSTKPMVIKSGQVLKKYSWLQSDTVANGAKGIAHLGLSEGVIALMPAMTTTQTLILGGLTFTAGTGSVTPAQLATIWKELPAGTSAAAANTLLLARGIDATTVGTFTSGTMTGWNTSLYNANGEVMFVSTTGLTNVTDLADTGTATDPLFSKVDGTTAFAPIAGMLLEDVNATSADVTVEVLVEGSIYADAITWAVDTNVDKMTDFDGTLVAYTAYNTGTNASDFATTRSLQNKFVEGSEFELVHIPDGDRP